MSFFSDDRVQSMITCCEIFAYLDIIDKDKYWSITVLILFPDYFRAFGKTLSYKLSPLSKKVYFGLITSFAEVVKGYVDFYYLAWKKSFLSSTAEILHQQVIPMR